jgi:hypothetical protein
VAASSILLLSACGDGGQALAHEACAHVTLSVRYFELSTKPDVSLTEANRLRTEADAELRAALPLAAEATSANGSLNSLMTTISEGATVDEAHLIPALKGQCALVDTNVNVNPTPGNVTTPSNVNPTPGTVNIPRNVNPTPGGTLPPGS